jgi:predicted GNAT superfamily acetyltransferase
VRDPVVSAEFEIAVATHGDIGGILTLQEENLPENGGMLSVRLPLEWFEAAMAEMPVVLARKDGQVVGYLVASTLRSQSHLPIIQSMTRAYSPVPDAYLYGPICVAASERGRGLPAQLFATQRRLVGSRPCFTFIRRDNPVSLRAHEKIGMHEVAEFAHDGSPIVVVTSAS